MTDIMALIDAYAEKRADAAALAGTRRAHLAGDQNREADAIRAQIVLKLAQISEITFEGRPAYCLEYCQADHMYLVEHESAQNPDWIEEDDPRLSIVRG